MTRAKSKKKGAVSAKHCTTASILNLSPLSFSLLKSALTSINGAMLAASVDASPTARDGRGSAGAVSIARV
jgi:hypothetical protein